MSCKYNKEVLCDREKTPCNTCAVEKVINTERERIRKALKSKDTVTVEEVLSIVEEGYP